MNRIVISCAGLSGKIYAGRVNKAGTAFLAGQQDVTSDVLKSVIDKIKPGNVEAVTVDGVPRFEIEVRNYTPAPPPFLYTGEDFIAAIREMYDEWQGMKEHIEGEKTRLPDFEKAVDYFARFGMSPITE